MLSGIDNSEAREPFALKKKRIKSASLAKSSAAVRRRTISVLNQSQNVANIYDVNFKEKVKKGRKTETAFRSTAFSVPKRSDQQTGLTSNGDAAQTMSDQHHTIDLNAVSVDVPKPLPPSGLDLKLNMDKMAEIRQFSATQDPQ